MSDATAVHAEIARLSKNRVFEPYPEATHLVRLDDAEDAVRRAFVAGRAAATETIPREDALQALHEMSTVAGLLRVRRDDPAVVALGDRLRLACRALRDVTAPGMNELMDSQPGRAAATPDPPEDDEFTEAAWGLIANAYGGNWDDAPDEWHGAAARWRDEYIAGATAHPPAAPDERLREALAWIAEYGERNGDLRTGHLQAVKHIARNALGLEPDLPLAAADRDTACTDRENTGPGGAVTRGIVPRGTDALAPRGPAGSDGEDR